MCPSASIDTRHDRGPLVLTGGRSVFSAEPLRERVAQGAGFVFGEQEHALAGDVRVELDFSVELADDDVGESAGSPVFGAAGVDDAPGRSAAGLAHVLTVAPRWNTGEGFTVASGGWGELATIGG